jgi:hypothetical protein
MSISVYVPNVVKRIKEFYGDLLWSYNTYPVIKNHLEAIALKHYEGILAKEDCVFIEMNNYNPDFIGKSVEQLKLQEFSEEDSKNTIAYEYGFKGWDELLAFDIKYEIEFETTINHLLCGDYESVEKAILKDNSLLSSRSNYGHRATLLHYCGNNGVEFWRQQVPRNLADLIQMLLDNGANKSAPMSVYGGEFDTLSLLSTSAHPEAAGMMEQLIEVLS